MGTKDVYCEVREESVYIIEVLRGNVMAQSVSRLPLIADAPVQFQFSRREICKGQNGSWTGLSTSTSVFTCQYHFTSSLKLIRIYKALLPEVLPPPLSQNEI